MTISLGRLVQRLEREGVLAEGFALDPRCVAAEVRDVTTDSRLASRGTVFCAVCGVEADGHLFVGHAAEAGAVAALVERVDPSLDLIQIPVVRRSARGGVRSGGVLRAIPGTG